jgi:hypothetical protein
VVEALIEELQTAELLHLDETPSRTLATQTGMTNDWLAQQGFIVDSRPVDESPGL